MEEMLTIDDVAKLVKVDRRRLENWQRQGKMPPPRWREHKLTRYLHSDILAWMRGEWRPAVAETTATPVSPKD